MYINKIWYILEKHNFLFGLFADDLTIWKIDDKLNVIKDTIQNEINDINSFFNENGLKLNGRKCTYTLFTNKPKERNDLSINIEIINYEPNPKSLGIYFDPKFKFNFHFSEIKKQLERKINVLRILSNKSNRIYVNHLLTIYKTLILSKLQHSCIPFMVTTNKIKKELQSIQNKCFKIILNLPTHSSSKFAHQTLKCEKLDKRLATLTCNFLNKSKQYNPMILS